MQKNLIFSPKTYFFHRTVFGRDYGKILKNMIGSVLRKIYAHTWIFGSKTWAGGGSELIGHPLHTFFF